MTEAELLAHVLAAAAELDVLAFHDGDSRTSSGYPGFPDLVLVGEHAEAWELKSATGLIYVDQAYWLRRMRGAGITTRIVRPESWPDEIKGWLRAIRGL